MASELLTDKRIRAIKAPATGRMEIWDSGESGLILRVSSTGRKTWALQYKTETFDGNGYRKTKKLTLGEYGAGGDKIGLKEARQRALRAKAAVTEGQDPAQAKIDERNSAKADGKRKNAATIESAVNAFCERFEKDVSKWKRQERPRILRKELAGPYGNRGIGELTLSNLKSQQKKIKARPAPVLANRFAEAVRGFYKWAVDEYGIENVASGIGRIVDEDDFRRDRFLTVKELNAIWKATERLSPVSRDFVRVLMLTPQRLSAVTNMRFSQIDYDGVWRIPRRQKKQKVSDQSLPLAQTVIDIIDARRPDDESDAGLVFCSGRAGDVPLQATSKIKATLNKALGDKFEPWRFHDFRRSFSTWAAASGIDQAVTRKILDHGQGVRDKLDAIYNQHAYLDEQRDALNAYAEAICHQKL